jgi:hypothetical protein
MDRFSFFIVDYRFDLALTELLSGFARTAPMR